MDVVSCFKSLEMVARLEAVSTHRARLNSHQTALGYLPKLVISTCNLQFMILITDRRMLTFSSAVCRSN